MALLTSLYLCSRTVYAAVGTPTGSGARVLAAAQTELPEPVWAGHDDEIAA